MVCFRKRRTECKSRKESYNCQEKDLNLALGWLAREGKVAFREEEAEVFIALV